MKFLWIALAAGVMAGCAVVPYPYAAPGVSVGVGVPVYRGGYHRGPYHRHGHYGHYGRPHHRRW